MALPDALPANGVTPTLTGILLGLTPSASGWDIELQRAPDNGSGQPDTGNAVSIARIPQSAVQGMRYLDLLPRDNANRFYRFRLALTGFDPGAWSLWTAAAKPTAIPEDFKLQSGGASLYPIRRQIAMQDGKYAVLATDEAGTLVDAGTRLDPAVGVAEGSTVYKIYRHREEITAQGPDTDGDVLVTFSQVYQNVPLVLPRGGQYLTYSSTHGASVHQRLRLQVLNLTTSGFTSRVQIVNAGATTAQSDDFASGNLIDAVGETAEVNLDPAGANDDTYTVHYFVEVEVEKTSPTGGPTRADLTVAIETNDGGGGGWVERATYVYTAIDELDDSTPVTETWTHQQNAIVVSGLGLNDDIRLRAKSFVVSGGAGAGTFIVRGGDAGGSNPETYNGVTYTTATDDADSAIPSTGDHVIWVAQEVT